MRKEGRRNLVFRRRGCERERERARRAKKKKKKKNFLLTLPSPRGRPSRASSSSRVPTRTPRPSSPCIAPSRSSLASRPLAARIPPRGARPAPLPTWRCRRRRGCSGGVSGLFVVCFVARARERERGRRRERKGFEFRGEGERRSKKNKNLVPFSLFLSFSLPRRPSLTLPKSEIVFRSQVRTPDGAAGPRRERERSGFEAGARGECDWRRSELAVALIADAIVAVAVAVLPPFALSFCILATEQRELGRDA